MGRVVDLVLLAVPVGVPFAVVILRCCFPLTFWREEFLLCENLEGGCVSFLFFFLEVLKRREVFNILAEEVLKMRRRGCCGLFLLKLIVYLHSLRFSGEVRLLEKNSKFENLLSEGSFICCCFLC